ncbi:predicted protein [Nematostella vectensis]|uniref:Importin N-terminal domain-containing protein n=1 Tax=Nematostella vectensis TaxID=45351 RepID=A7RWP4_NEMVE|nr:predicted protein [Nematostella vectensis]|eukprot:XP_001636221.1 predicted protein [Nematostella vectensis]
MDLTKVLEATVSPDLAELQAAQKYLEEAAQVNLPQFLLVLVNELADGSKSQVARMAAGLQLKNQLTSKDDIVRAQYQQRWLGLDKEVRDHVKKMSLATLGNETARPAIAPQCIAAIACAEIPTTQDLEIIDKLVANEDTGSPELLREQTLEAIGYICQDIEPEHLVSHANKILTVIIQGMRKEEPSNHIRLAATTALLNSLEFTKQNFEKAAERDFIMQVVCESTQSSQTTIKVAALQCLVKIMSLYYQHMEEYMRLALFGITVEAIKSDTDEVALQGIEFWSTVCDEEMDLAIEMAEAQEAGRPPENTSRFYAKGALAFLIPPITNCLINQEEYDDEDDWNPCKAAGVCLMLLAQCCEDAIVQPVLEFVNVNFASPSWKNKDAAIMAFGAILEGPDPKTLQPFVENALPVIAQQMKDESVVVRDSAAWVLGRVCEIMPHIAINEKYLVLVVTTLLESLIAEPRVASNVCWAFSSLSEAAYEAATDQNSEEEPQTYCLSQFFNTIIEKLLEVTVRPDAGQCNLRSAAYEAVMEMIKNSPKDCYGVVQKTTLDVMQRLQHVLQLERQVPSNERAQYNDLQSLLCATLQSVLRKINPPDAVQIAESVMTALLQMFGASAQGGTSGVQEDALMAVGTLVEVIGINFMQYMESFMPFLEVGLKNKSEYQVCTAAVGLVGDIARGLGVSITQYSDRIMQILMENCHDETVHRSVKPHILSVFGDIALATGPHFKKYLDVVIATLTQATQVQVVKTDYDMIDYLNELRESCLEAYTGIIQGLKGDAEKPNPAEVEVIKPHIQHIIGFLELIAEDQDHSEGNVTCASGLIGDICEAFGTEVHPMLDKPSIQDLLQEGRRSKNHKTKQVANWASRKLRTLKQL